MVAPWGFQVFYLSHYSTTPTLHKEDTWQPSLDCQANSSRLSSFSNVAGTTTPYTAVFVCFRVGL